MLVVEVRDMGGSRPEQIAGLFIITFFVVCFRTSTMCEDVLRGIGKGEAQCTRT